MKITWDYNELAKEMDKYFSNTKKEQIIKDLIDACGGVEKFNEMLKKIESE